MGTPERQVDTSHYKLSRYLTRERWLSCWHQLDEVQRLMPETVLEIGPGPGVFQNLAELSGIRVETLDMDPELLPDHLAPADDMPFEDGAFDVVCAFQMLEHVPYEESLSIFAEMNRVAASGVVISLPHARPLWSFTVHWPGHGPFDFFLPRPWTGPKAHAFDGQHYWEIGTRGFSLGRVVSDLERVGGRALSRSFRVHRYAYHCFLVFG